MTKTGTTQGTVVAVSLSVTHTFSKIGQNEINLITGLGVEGDAHNGKTVKHRSRVAKDPTQPNLRQVHFIHEELFHELSEQGFDISPGKIGENITTRDINLLALPKGTILRVGNEAIVEVKGLRNPCRQLDDFQSGLMHACLDRDKEGNLIRKTGVMGVVVNGGVVKPDDPILVELPPEPHIKLEKV